jgi:hypothetical protein
MRLLIVLGIVFSALLPSIITIIAFQKILAAIEIIVLACPVIFVFYVTNVWALTLFVQVLVLALVISSPVAFAVLLVFLSAFQDLLPSFKILILAFSILLVFQNLLSPILCAFQNLLSPALTLFVQVLVTVISSAFPILYSVVHA